jgi:hypothetical protein
MRLVMTLLVRDEEDIVEDNLRYHLAQGVDFFLVTDNASTDSTPEILERFAAKGLLRVLYEEQETWNQEEWVTRMARLAAAEHGADWVINNDADEFWWPRVGTLKEVFAAVPEQYGAVMGARVNFIPRPDDGRPFYERMTIAEVQSLKQGKRRAELAPISSKRAHRASAEVTVGRGSHRVYPREGLPSVPRWQPFLVFHYPLRSYEQFERRTLLPETVYQQIPPGERTYLFELHRQGKLREYWDAKQLDGAAIAAGLRQGLLCKDDRLSRFMRELDPSALVPVEPPRSMASAADLPLDLRYAVRRATWKERRRNTVVGQLDRARELAGRAERRAERAARRLERIQREVDRLESGLCARMKRLVSRRG